MHFIVYIYCFYMDVCVYIVFICCIIDLFVCCFVVLYGLDEVGAVLSSFSPFIHEYTHITVKYMSYMFS